MFFSVITKNLFLKDKTGLTMKIFNILGVHWKIRFLGGGIHLRKTNIERGLPKKGGLDSFQI